MISNSSGKYSSFTDQELISRFTKNRNNEVLGELYKRYMYMVYGVCMKYLKNREDSQDAVIQIFEVLIIDVPRFEIRNFKSWLYGVSRNYCLMKLRRDISARNRLHKISDDFFMESTIDLHPIEETENEKIQEKLKACLEQLKDEQRTCIELFYYQEKCYREIASALNLDEQNVKSYIQNGKRNLKICIESKSEIKNVR